MCSKLIPSSEWGKSKNMKWLTENRKKPTESYQNQDCTGLKWARSPTKIKMKSHKRSKMDTKYGCHCTRVHLRTLEPFSKPWSLATTEFILCIHEIILLPHSKFTYLNLDFWTNLYKYFQTLIPSQANVWLSTSTAI